jgi:formamidopyrimidine-DNA glycosylase
MPELPETETIARDLDAEVRGATITGVHVHRADVLREMDARELARRATGARIERAWRRAKLVVLDLSTGDRLVVQPRFTGGVLVDAGQLDEREHRFLRVTLDLDDGRRLHYRDIRCLGTVALMGAERFAAYAGALGTEPLDPAFSAAHLSELVRGSRQAVKKLLMDQRRLVGVGNIYANEALWRARIHPGRAGGSLSAAEVRRLRDAVVGVLEESIRFRGTSFRDYVDGRGERGSFVERLAAYGRAGEPCLRCGRALENTHEIDGRQTVFCPHCQP